MPVLAARNSGSPCSAARILAICESYDALTTDRPFRPAHAHEAALRVMTTEQLFRFDPHLIDRHRLTRVNRVNLRVGDYVRVEQGPAAGTVVRFDGAVPFVNLQVSHDPAQIWVLVSAITMMAGLVVSLLVRRRRIWIRLLSASPGTVKVQVGGLARTDNAGWGDEFERLVAKLEEGLSVAPAEPVATGRSTP